MASLGQLVAGVAHEINNPLSYVTNNLAVLDRDVRIVADLIALYRRHFGDSLPQDLIDAEARIDLPYTLAGFDRLVESSRDGLARVREIVAALRDFSRIDEAEHKEIDPNEVVRDTLEVVRYAVKQKEVDLRVDLADSLPAISCSPGKLNQVVLNILLNAVQAVEPRARIDVRTRSDPDRGEVRYEVTDTGPGIPEAIRDRIFDPFFTTKPPGVGTRPPAGPLGQLQYRKGARRPDRGRERAWRGDDLRGRRARRGRPAVKTKAEIVRDWLPRYHGPADRRGSGNTSCLSNFVNYVELFAQKFGVEVMAQARTGRCSRRRPRG